MHLITGGAGFMYRCVFTRLYGLETVGLMWIAYRTGGAAELG